MITQTQDKSEQTLELYRHLLKFNYFKDLNSLRIPIKINLELDELPQTEASQFSKIPLHFANAETYVRMWEPLFLEELRSYIVSASATEGTNDERCELVSYFELGTFQIMEFKLDTRCKTVFSQNTLVVLSPGERLNEVTGTNLMGIIHRADASLYVRCFLNLANREEKEKEILTTTKSWFIRGLCPISSIQREFKALNRFENIESSIKEILLRPQQFKNPSTKQFVIPEKLQKRLHQIYNESQLQAISAGLKQEGITLIQGPPGTGKTKTVLGTLSVLLQSSLNKEEEEEVPLLLRWKTSQKNIKEKIEDLNPWILPGYVDWRDQPLIKMDTEPLLLTKFYPVAQRTITLMSRQQAPSAPLRVLVCGPSNASVDEVIRKMLGEQLLDGFGETYLPKFVRLGQNYHESLQEHSLEYLANQQLKTEKSDVMTLKKKILRESRLVFTTLSAAGSGILQSAEIQFDTVVIDEGGQAVELSCLIPLMYSCKRLILIGDPKQLPATVFSPICLRCHYDQSLFERLMRSEYPVSMLKIQYRMHKDISQVIGHTFYQGLLEDGNQMLVEPQGVPSSFILLHIDNSCEIFGEQSYYNAVEGECVKVLVQHLSKNYKDIGVLSPYSAQVKWLNQQKLGNKCQIKTIDSFQGREKSVIIFSAVRAQKAGREGKDNRKHTIGFVGDGRRLNVALSRAKDVCVIVGDLNRLQLSKVWKGIIQQGRKKGQAFKVSCAQELRQMGKNISNLRPY